jgi:hypothetical protein
LMANIMATLPNFRDLFLEFQDVINPSVGIYISRHGIQYILETKGRPLMVKILWLNPDTCQAANT